MKSRARELRSKQTDAERLLWNKLRNRQLAGFKFRRQCTVEPYIVDFVCIEAKLIVELDGGQHQMQDAYDGRRSQYLTSLGFKVLRFWNNDVLANMTGVLEIIRGDLINSPHPCPLREGEGVKSTSACEA